MNLRLLAILASVLYSASMGVGRPPETRRVNRKKLKRTAPASDSLKQAVVFWGGDSRSREPLLDQQN